MQSNKTKKRHKVFGLFSSMRLYNIALLIIAQYLTSIFIFTIDQPLSEVLFNLQLHSVVFGTLCVVSAGYLINDFYDFDLDKINKPLKTHIGNWVSKKTKLYIYFTLNFIGFVIGFLVSGYIALFFAFYIFLIWYYSHKLQKFPIIGLLTVSVLDIFPFFLVFLFYKNISSLIIIHAFFLFGLLVAKEIVKDFTRVRGAILNNRETLVTKYGAKYIKILFISILVLLCIQVIYILKFPEIGKMKYYFFCFLFFVPPFVLLLLRAKKAQQYLRLHNLLKFVLVVGMFSLIFIDTSIWLVKVLNKIKM